MLLVAIAWLSLIPQTPQPQLFSWSDKLFHGVVYAALTGWFGNLLTHSKMWFAVGALCLYGALIEVIQPFTGRAFDWFDMLANITGCFLAAALLSLGADRIVQWFDAELRDRLRAL